MLKRVHRGQKDIGISKKIANFGVTAVSSSKPKAEDVQETPSYLKSQEKYNPDPTVKDKSGKGSVSGKKDVKNIPTNPTYGVGFSKASNGIMAVVGLYQWADENFSALSWAYDKGQTEWDLIQLKISVMEVNAALHIEGLIPPEYRTEENLAAITNVVLQGVNTTNDKKIYEIGMKIYNTFHPSKSENKDNTTEEQTKTQ